MITDDTFDALWERICESHLFEDGPFSVGDVLERLGMPAHERNMPGLQQQIAERLDRVAHQHKEDDAEQHFQRLPDGRYTFNFPNVAN